MLNRIGRTGVAGIFLAGLIGTSAFTGRSPIKHPAEFTSFSMTACEHTVHGYNQYTFGWTGWTHTGNVWEVRSTSGATDNPATGTYLAGGTFSAGANVGSVDVPIDYAGAPYSMYIWIRAVGEDEDTGWFPFEGNAFTNTNACAGGLN